MNKESDLRPAATVAPAERRSPDHLRAAARGHGAVAWWGKGSAPNVHGVTRMWSAVAACVDFAHASFMAAWVLGLPLLFWHRWPRLTRAYAVYAIAFVALNVASKALLGECFLTVLSRACWQTAALAGGRAPATREWFTVRMAEAVFRLTPSHRGIKLTSEALILVTAIGVLVSSLSGRVRTGVHANDVARRHLETRRELSPCRTPRARRG